MTVVVDASALVAILRDEPDADGLAGALLQHDDRLTSAIALWESARAIARGRADGIEAALAEVERYCMALGIRVVPLGAVDATEAVRAHAAYGKGTGHPAQLNMGDCFAYACARGNEAQLLYKGDDFSRTDLR